MTSSFTFNRNAGMRAFTFGVSDGFRAFLEENRNPFSPCSFVVFVIIGGILACERNSATNKRLPYPNKRLEDWFLMLHRLFFLSDGRSG